MVAPRFTRLLAALGCAGSLTLGVAACGDSEPEISVSTDSATDGELGAAIEAELDQYSEQFDLSALPAGAQAQLGAAIDNFPQAAGAVTALDITDGTVVARTELEQNEGSAVTARLICGAILRSIDDLGREDPGGHVVLGEGEQVLGDCAAEDKNFP